MFVAEREDWLSVSLVVLGRMVMVNRRRLVTAEGFKELEDELHELRGVRRPEVAAKIHEAIVGGGTADNAEYEEAKNEQAFVEGRIRDLEEILYNAVVPEVAPDAEDRVQFGASVAVKSDDGRERRYLLVGSAEAKPLEGKISNESPVGMALMDRRVGDVVEVKTPAGVQKLTIVEVGHGG